MPVPQSILDSRLDDFRDFSRQTLTIAAEAAGGSCLFLVADL